jgi:hypothetical protein
MGRSHCVPLYKRYDVARLRTRAVVVHISELLGGELVDFVAHGGELQLGDVLILLVGDVVHGDIEALALFGELGNAELRKELIGEAHVHHFRTTTFGFSDAIRACGTTVPGYGSCQILGSNAVFHINLCAKLCAKWRKYCRRTCRLMTN